VRLKNKKAIITGASKNIGAAIALKFAQEGADILLHYNNDKKGVIETENKIRQLGRKVSILQCDFSSNLNISNFITKAVEFLEGIDVLVNNAGAYDTSNFRELSHNTLQLLLSVGVISPMQIMQYVTNIMIDNNILGSIINISSVSGLRPYPNRTAHATAKAALNMLTKNSAIDLGKYGIRVNAICPGSIPYEGGREYVTKGIPLQRLGKPEDIANAAVFLASDESSWITGHLMVVDGGHSLSIGM